MYKYSIIQVSIFFTLWFDLRLGYLFWKWLAPERYPDCHVHVCSSPANAALLITLHSQAQWLLYVPHALALKHLTLFTECISVS
jgi:hypothetical protein